MSGRRCCTPDGAHACAYCGLIIPERALPPEEPRSDMGRVIDVLTEHKVTDRKLILALYRAVDEMQWDAHRIGHAAGAEAMREAAAQCVRGHCEDEGCFCVLNAAEIRALPLPTPGEGGAR